MCNSHTEKVEYFLTKISHKILCDIHMTVFTVYLRCSSEKPYNNSYRILCSNFWMESFSKKPAIRDFENNILLIKQGYTVASFHCYLVTYFETILSKMPHSFQNFCTYSHLKITIYMVHMYIHYIPFTAHNTYNYVIHVYTVLGIMNYICNISTFCGNRVT